MTGLWDKVGKTQKTLGNTSSRSEVTGSRRCDREARTGAPGNDSGRAEEGEVECVLEARRGAPSRGDVLENIPLGAADISHFFPLDLQPGPRRLPGNWDA